MVWDKSGLVDWFRKNEHRMVSMEVSEVSDFPLLQGRVSSVMELDVCSSILTEATILLEVPLPSGHHEAYLTFHDGFIGIQLLAEDGEPPAVSYEVPYFSLKLERLSLN